MYRNRRRIRSTRLRLLRVRGERLERPFAHLYETGGMRFFGGLNARRDGRSKPLSHTRPH